MPLICFSHEIRSKSSVSKNFLENIRQVIPSVNYGYIIENQRIDKQQGLG